MAEGAARSQAAQTPGPTPVPGAGRSGVYRAHGAWLAVWVRDLWERRRWWLIGAGILLLVELIAGLAASASGGHF